MVKGVPAEDSSPLKYSSPGKFINMPGLISLFKMMSPPRSVLRGRTQATTTLPDCHLKHTTPRREAIISINSNEICKDRCVYLLLRPRTPLV